MVSCFIDIDECALDTHNCAHKCVDASPGFTCECEFGYTTTNEGVTCTGVLNKIMLFYSDTIIIIVFLSFCFVL